MISDERRSIILDFALIRSLKALYLPGYYYSVMVELNNIIFTHDFRRKKINNSRLCAQNKLLDGHIPDILQELRQPYEYILELNNIIFTHDFRRKKINNSRLCAQNKLLDGHIPDILQELRQPYEYIRSCGISSQEAHLL